MLAQYNTFASGNPLPEPVCAAAFVAISASSPNANGPANFFILGDPFMAKFPATFFGPGASLTEPDIKVPCNLWLQLGRRLAVCSCSTANLGALVSRLQEMRPVHSNVHVVLH